MSGYEIGFIILCFGVAGYLLLRGLKHKPPTTVNNFHD